ncbi:hypothetical protein MNBD_ALPHA04-927, partial [hydrothermal vent metagenome]
MLVVDELKGGRDRKIESDPSEILEENISIDLQSELNEAWQTIC